MKRRVLLMGASFATTGLAGCLSSFSGEDRNKYEQCGNSIVYISSLPTPAKEEVRAAINDDVYETDGDLVLSEVINTDEAYLYEDEFTYYNVTVTHTDTVSRLRVRETRPKRADLPEMENKLETNITVDIRIKYENNLVFEDSIDLDTGESTDLDNGTDYHWGKYHAMLTIHTETEAREEEITWIDNHIYSDYMLFISSDNGVYGDSKARARIWCEWNDNGELVSGQ